jgi:RNA-directed DNA polymerase
MYRWPPNLIRNHLETGPRILLSQWAVLALFYINLNKHLRKYNGKLLIKPSKKNIHAFLEDIRKSIKANKQATAGNLIAQLNPIMRGWCYDHRWVICTEAFNTCDHITFLQLCRWGKTRHPKKSTQWVRAKYFIRVEERNRFGTFFKDEEGQTTPMYVVSHVDTHHQDSILVRGSSSPYDGKLLY